MSALPGGSVPSVPGINSPPPVSRSNPDRQRREQGARHPTHHKDPEQAPKREQDSAELTHHEDAPAVPPASPKAPPASTERPHIDIQG